MPPEPRVSVGVCAVVRPPTRLYLPLGYRLMVQRAGTQSYADGHGTWSVPGGWVDFDEHPMTTAKREVMEETGVTVEPLKLLGLTQNMSDDFERSVITLFVACAWVAGKPQVTEPDKCAEVGWYDLKDGRELFTPLKRWLKSGQKL
jgi:8-oxo-dGTP diphosphatase